MMAMRYCSYRIKVEDNSAAKDVLWTRQYELLLHVMYLKK